MSDLPSSSTSSSSSVPLRVAGCWSGQIEAFLDLWTVADLRSSLSSSSGVPVDSFNAICAGKILKDIGSSTLRQVGVKPNSKILMTRIAPRQHTSALHAEEERHARLTRIKVAADAMVKRSGQNTNWNEHFDIQLENQSGDKLRLNSENDRKALMLGLMLHAKARDLILHKNYAEALEVLTMAEEAFDICDSGVLEAVDNVAFLQLDTVWCYFALKDMAKLTDAGKRLDEARKGFLRAHGPRLERIRILHGSFSPELAVYLRMDLLEGIVAFHCGRFEAAEKLLRSAQTKYNQLYVLDESLAFLTELGFSVKESTRALRISEQNVDRAIDFATQERKKELKRQEEDRKHAQQRRELKQYGRTATGNVIELLKLDELLSIGYEKRLAAETLRQTDNDLETALDILTDPTRNAAIQSTIICKRKRTQTEVDSEALLQLLVMGFEERQAIRALRNTSNLNEALTQLLQGSSSSPTVELGHSSSSSHEISVVTANANEEQIDAAVEGQNSVEDEEEEEEEEEYGRDREMEAYIAANITGDQLAAYDLDVELEGKTLFEYLDMLKSRMNE